MKHYKTIQVDGVQKRLHRHLMEVKLNRKLGFNEIVHHKDGNKFNNDINNLEVVSRSSHIKMHHEIIEKCKEKNTYNIDNVDLAKMYETMTILEISKMLNIAQMTVWYRLKKIGVKTTKIDSNDLKTIREMIKNNVKLKDIAIKFNTTISTISNIKHKTRYANK